MAENFANNMDGHPRAWWWSDITPRRYQRGGMLRSNHG